MNSNMNDNADVEMQNIPRLDFSDWIKHQESFEWWIPVAQSTECCTDKALTSEMLSVLVNDDYDKSNFNKIILDDLFQGLQEHNDNLANKNFRYYECSYRLPNNAISLFVMPRRWHNDNIVDFAIIEKFVFYYNLRLEGSTFVDILDTGDKVEVIRTERNNNIATMHIRRQYLMNYLARNKKLLVRIHHKNIHTTTPIINLNIGDLKHNVITDDSGNKQYIVSIKPLNDNSTKYRYISTLDGYDVIQSNTFSYIHHKQYCEFVVDCDEFGFPNKKSCGSNSTDFTPIFFTKDVLEKYYHNYAKYTVCSDILHCGTLWSMKFDHGDRFVSAQLCDLGHLPYDEQCHWLLHSVPDYVKRNIGYFQRNFYAEFVHDWDTVSVFKRSLNDLQKISIKKFGFELFMSLEDYDQRVINCLRIPSPYDEGVFYDQILGLAKLLPDSINVKKMENDILQPNNENVGRCIDSKKINKLQQFLATHNITIDLTLLKNLQKLRSSGHAHRRDERYTALVKKLRQCDLYLHNDTWDISFQKIIRKLTDLLNTLCKKIYTLPNVSLPESQSLINNTCTNTQLKQMLEFKDWLIAQKTDNHWITVANYINQHDDKISKQFMTISVLENAKDAQSCLQKIDIRTIWFGLQKYDIDPDDDTKKSRYYYWSPLSLDNRDVSPFIVNKIWHDKESSGVHFDIVEDFIFFYNLKRQDTTFVDITESENIEVIHIIKTDDIYKIEINREYLLNYLYKKKLFLVRIHNNKIMLSHDPKILESHDSPYSNSTFNLSISVYQLNGAPYNIISDLDGVDVIESPKYSH